MGSTEILGSLYIKPGIKVDRHESQIALWSNLSKCLHISKHYEIQIGVDFISVSISNATPDMRCSVHVCSADLITHFSDFFS